MFVWFVGWLDGWLVEWLVGWLDVWLVGWLVGWMVGWLFDLPLPANQKLRPLFLPKPLHPATVSRFHTSEGPTYRQFPPPNILYRPAMLRQLPTCRLLYWVDDKYKPLTIFGSCDHFALGCANVL